jgi:hypothetical protein
VSTYGETPSGSQRQPENSPRGDDIDFAAILADVATHFFGKPNDQQSNSKEQRWGTNGSFAIKLKDGTWYDHEKKEGGGTLDLVMREAGLPDKPAAVDWLKRHGFVRDRRSTNGSGANPNEAELKRRKAKAKLGPIVDEYDYTDDTGSFLYQVTRHEPKDFRQRHKDARGNWVWGFPEGVAHVPFKLPELIEDVSMDREIAIVEGERDVNNLRDRGVPATTNAGGANKWQAELSEHFRGARVCIVPDNDEAGRKHAVMVAAALKGIARSVRILELWLHWPGMPDKGDVSDWLEKGSGTPDKLRALIDQAPEYPPKPESRSLDDVRKVFQKWLGADYDLDALDATLAAAAAERLAGDPLWLLVVAGPGAAKTETVQALSGAGAHVTSTITSEGALLSASPRKSRAKTATGGLLRKIGDRGILVIKDVTSILSADRNVRQTVLAAIREIYDGRWERNVGTDGGQTLTWTGRIVVVGAVTTAWDTHHAVVATLGDRFVLLRIDSEAGRVKSGTRAIRNTGSEAQMREELADAVGGLIAHASTDDVRIEDDEVERLIKMADIVTKARTGVERDYRGDVTMAHDPEMPTRFGKQLAQVIRGAVAIGMTREAAMRLAVRCARDSIPPLRLEIMLDVAANPGAQVGEVRRRIDKPWQTVKREVDALHMLGILECDEKEDEDDDDEDEPKSNTRRRKWHYKLRASFDRATLLAMAAIDATARWRQPGLF